MDKTENLPELGSVEKSLTASGFGRVQLKMPGLLTFWRSMALSWVALAIVGISSLFIIVEFKLAGLTGARLFMPFCLAIIVSLVVAWIYAGKRFAAYEITLFPGQGVRVRSGVLWRKEVWLPIARLQHLDVNQGPLDRKWGMASLVLHTAGTHDHELALQGLSLELAHQLRELLMPRTQVAHD